MTASHPSRARRTQARAAARALAKASRQLTEKRAREQKHRAKIKNEGE